MTRVDMGDSPPSHSDLEEDEDESESKMVCLCWWEG